MGQCGCSDTAPDFQLPGPDGLTYAIQVYPSCHYCQTPAGIDVYRMTTEDALVWLDGVEQAPFMPYDTDDPASAQLAIPIVEPSELAKALVKETGESAGDLAREIRFALPEAVFETLFEWGRTHQTMDGAS